MELLLQMRQLEGDHALLMHQYKTAETAAAPEPRGRPRQQATE
jgi:hypothetical protein